MICRTSIYTFRKPWRSDFLILSDCNCFRFWTIVRYWSFLSCIHTYWFQRPWQDLMSQRVLSKKIRIKRLKLNVSSSSFFPYPPNSTPTKKKKKEEEEEEEMSSVSEKYRQKHALNCISDLLHVCKEDRLRVDYLSEWANEWLTDWCI